MNSLQRLFRLTALFMATVMFLVSLPVNAARAGLVKTEDVIEQATATAQRQRVKDFVHREDVRKQMRGLGIQPEEAARRVDALSDAEVAQIAGYLDEAPAGQSFIAAVLGAIVVIFLVLILTDLLGLTDVFPFIKSQRR
jgi:cytochrome c1